MTAGNGQISVKKGCELLNRMDWNTCSFIQ